MTITEARLHVRTFARNAGVSTSTQYSDTDIDNVIQSVGQRFCRNTRCVRSHVDIPLLTGIPGFNIPSPTTLMPEQVMNAKLSDGTLTGPSSLGEVANTADGITITLKPTTTTPPLVAPPYGLGAGWWATANGSDPTLVLSYDSATLTVVLASAIIPLEGGNDITFYRIPGNERLSIVDIDDYTDRLECDSSTGEPQVVAFETPYAGFVYPTPDDDYGMVLYYWQTFTTWTAGTAVAAVLASSLNIPDQFIMPVVQEGASGLLQRNEPEHAQTAEKRWQAYLEYEQKMMGAGSLAGQVVRRASLSGRRRHYWRA